jgi:hypothetical protein
MQNRDRSFLKSQLDSEWDVFSTKILSFKPVLRIRDPEYRLKKIPDPGSRVKNISDPGSGSALKNLSIFNPKIVFKLWVI